MFKVKGPIYENISKLCRRTGHSPTMFMIRDNYSHLLYKVQCVIRNLGTDKTDNLTCESIYDNFTCENYRFSNNHQSQLLDILYW